MRELLHEGPPESFGGEPPIRFRRSPVHPIPARPVARAPPARLAVAIIPPMSLTIVMVADIPRGAEASFQAYESAVLPLLSRHGGRLERRFRTGDALTEVHIVSFESHEGFESYLADEERQSSKRLLQ